MICYGKEIQKTHIVYFTGTGGTARAAKAFANSLAERGCEAVVTELRVGTVDVQRQGELLVLLYPVYAFNAPPLIYEWIAANTADKIPAVVLSVSGGGEMTPNTACRLKVNRALEKAGYDVVYENMLVMPSNCMDRVPDGVAMQLLRILPKKVEHIVEEVSASVRRRTKPHVLDRVVTKIAELEKHGAVYAGKRFYAEEACNSCGLCARGCPRGNVAMENGKPKYGAKCVLCLKCIYGCPKHAIRSKIKLVNRFVFEEGYDLDALEKRMKDTTGAEPASVEALMKGFEWKGVCEYLAD